MAKRTPLNVSKLNLKPPAPPAAPKGLKPTALVAVASPARGKKFPSGPVGPPKAPGAQGPTVSLTPIKTNRNAGPKAGKPMMVKKSGKC